MRTRLLLLVVTVCFAFAASAQWSIDSIKTAGIVPFRGGTTTKAVFSNGSEWNVFDANTNVHTWGTFSISRAQIQVVSYGDKVYFGGGKYGYFTDPQYTKNVDVYNAITNSWSTLSLSKNREVGGAGAAGNKIVFAGGTGRSDISGPVYIYNTADIFDATTGARTTGKLSKARSNIAVGASGNKIVFAGGWFWDMSYNVLTANNADIYDVSTGLWTKAALSKKRENISVAVVGDKIIFAGGTGGNTGGAVTNVDIYDAVTNTWTVTNLPVARYGMKSVVIGNNAYFAGGAYDPAENAVDIYNAVTGTWATIYMPTSLSGFSMSVIDSKIYFAGGYITATSAYSDLVQIFDPGTATWTTDHLSVARNYTAAVTCVNKGFFAGGYIAYGYPIPVATKRVDIYASSSPVADFTANAMVITAGQTVNFTDNSTNNPTSWSWTFNGGTPSTSTIQNPSGIQYNTAGNYDVTLTVSNASGSSTVTKSGFITVNPAACVVPSVFSATNITSSSATLNWNAPGGSIKYKMSYKQSGNNPWITVTITNTSWQISGLLPNTTYLWKVKSMCSGSATSPFSADQSFTTSPAKESIPMNSVLAIYPDPVQDQFRISLSEELTLPLDCQVYDMYGNMVKQVEITDYLQTIKVNDLVSGNYLLTVTDMQNTRLSTRMTKQ